MRDTDPVLSVAMPLCPERTTIEFPGGRQHELESTPLRQSIE